ncbi:unnamed protein product (macronuclear) [Paramecium tetraurelia]|uniref:RING-type domain-containing protein n=1 Tax=Paramecium tetraurelia TaxID=5888 RepID=A0DIR5_PARTE|nr:uncharacterized protein GSPATT00017289001 [Paramecium tetraurelia]CAK82932.1 unnamed protein product [Paramecium tetraurelia]|eukprot:XP_001450329.1 hypothetical protein (macronuclear) [Paramecium tetraurelia strain d4-2]
MQDKPQELITCKFCKERFPLTIMYAHRMECNIENHPDYQSVVQNKESMLQKIQEEFPDDSQNILQTNKSKFNKNQKVENPGLEKQLQEEFSYQLKREIAPQAVKQQQKLNDLQTESILVRTTKKCEYCNELFPIEQIDDHYPNCQTYLMIEQLQIEETQNKFQSNENYIDKQSMIGQQKEPENFSTIIHEELQSDGKILQKIITRDPLTNKTYENVFLLDSDNGKQIEHISQQIIVPNDNRSFHQSFQSFINKDLIDLDQIEANDQQKLLVQQIRFQNLVRINFCDSKQLDQEFKQCGICFMNYLKGEELFLLPCIHRFHAKCMSKWLIDQSTCPICKIDFEQQKT